MLMSPVDCQPLRDVRERNEDVITIILQVAVVHRGDDLTAYFDGDTRQHTARRDRSAAGVGSRIGARWCGPRSGSGPRRAARPRA